MLRFLIYRQMDPYLNIYMKLVKYMKLERTIRVFSCLSLHTENQLRKRHGSWMLMNFSLSTAVSASELGRAGEPAKRN
jgi:hypothetical protein